MPAHIRLIEEKSFDRAEFLVVGASPTEHIETVTEDATVSQSSGYVHLGQSFPLIGLDRVAVGALSGLVSKSFSTHTADKVYIGLCKAAHAAVDTGFARVVLAMC